MGELDARRVVGRLAREQLGPGGRWPFYLEARRRYGSWCRLLQVLKGPMPLRVPRSLWVAFWMQGAGPGGLGRVAARMATWGAPPHRARRCLAGLNGVGYIAPGATLYHDDLKLGRNIFVGDGVILYQAAGGGAIEMGDQVSLYGNSYLETGDGGHLSIGAGSNIQFGCQLMAIKGAIEIGCGVGIGQNCALYPYDHGTDLGASIHNQPLQSQGPIIIEDGAWLGTGVIVLSGVRIGKGAVIGAGSVVGRNVPDGAIATGVPARVVRMRAEGSGPAPEIGG